MRAIESADFDRSRPVDTSLLRPWPPTDEEFPERSTHPAVSVVVPTLNEEKNIGWVLRRLPAELHEVIIVDGRSVDDTVAVARAAPPGRADRRAAGPRQGRGPGQGPGRGHR